MICKVVIGPPGSGKTHFLTQKAKELIRDGYTLLICSLTKAAASEIAGRGIPIPREQVGTLHSLCWRTLGMDDGQMTQNNLEEWNKVHPDLRVSLKKINVDDPFSDDFKTQEYGDKHKAAYDLARHLCQETESLEYGTQCFIKLWEEWKKEEGLIDFTDMITLGPSRPPCDANVLLVDEAQDHSKLELNKLREWAKHCNVIYLVGDPRQSLYVWRGAYPEMFFSDKVADENREILGQSYRVPRKVHALSEKWAHKLSDYHSIEYKPTDSEGHVGYIDGNWKDCYSIIRKAQSLLAEGKSVMVCASCAYMLNPLLKELKYLGVPFCNPWRMDHWIWNPLQVNGTSMGDRLLAYLRPDDRIWEQPRSWTMGEFNLWVDLLDSKKTLVRGAKKHISTIAEHESGTSYALVDDEFIKTWVQPDYQWPMREMAMQATATQRSLNFLWNNCLDSKKKPLSYPISILKRQGREGLTQPPKLYMGTIHSFKGAEADAVIIFPDLSPSGHKAWTGGPKAKDSVVRQFYVAITRAKEEVYITNAHAWMAVEL